MSANTITELTVARGPRVAMVGAGQLARMTHQAAIDLGIELRVLAGAEDDAAVRAGAEALVGGAGDLDALRALADGCEVLTLDHENVPGDVLRALEDDGIRVAPPASAKRYAQDKAYARRALADAGFPVPPHTLVRDGAAADAFAADHGWPLVGKLPAGGYDGRGVFELAGRAEAEEALAQAPDGILLEPLLELERELAVIVARTSDGRMASYPVVETVQRDAMCREIVAPAPVPAAIAAGAHDLAERITGHIGAVGVVAVELFVSGGRLLVNELALRPHNSGHYTIEGAETSQFEQHLRAVLGLPLGSTALRAPAVVTVNVVGTDDEGDPTERLAAALAVPGAHVHRYGKAFRPGRKLGHVTVCGEDANTVRAAAVRAAGALEGRRS